MAPTEVGMLVDCVQNTEESCKKMKKTRRGKKKHVRFASSSSQGALFEPYTRCGCGAENKDPAHVRPSTQTFEPQTKDVSKAAKRKGGKFLRPVGLFAPENSTQFLIADHIGFGSTELDLFQDLISPKKLRCDDGAATESEADRLPISDSLKSSPAYSDIDYEYRSPEDIDMLLFLQQDFESALSEAYQCDLMEQSKDELVLRVLKLEKTEEELERRLQAPSKLSSSRDEDFELKVLLQELHKLTQENVQLKAECNTLKESR